MNVLYSTENLLTRRNIAYKNYFDGRSDTLILNKPIPVTFHDSNGGKFKFFFLVKLIIRKISANRELIKTLKLTDNIENIIILFPGVIDLIYLTLFGRSYRNKLIFDYFVVFYQTLITDRDLIKSKTLQLLILKLEKLIMKIPSKLIVETEEIKAYINKTINPGSNIYVLQTPTNENIFSYKKVEKKSIKEIDFLYWGTYINLHGLEILIQAAANLDDKYKIYLLGDGQEFSNINNLVKKFNLENVTFDKTLFSKNHQYEYFYDLLSKSKIAIGTLSNSEKNNIVVPSKVMEAAALKIPFITYKSESMLSNSKDDIAYFIEEPLVKNLEKRMREAIKRHEDKSDFIQINAAYDWFHSYGTQSIFNHSLFGILR